ERYRADDARIREVVDARNALDTAAYQVERRLGELGEATPEHERARAQLLVTDARQAVKDDTAPLERLRSLTGELQQIFHSLGSAPSAAAAGGPGPGTGGPGPGGAEQGVPGQRGPTEDEDVIDAEFTTE
ncbi:molecular chaperone DnaK, partial [Actinopolymorpha pittospori]